MSTLIIQCGMCKVKSWLEFNNDFTTIPYRECEKYPDGIPEYVETINPDNQKDCPKFEEIIL